jgi:hypothetical protein
MYTKEFDIRLGYQFMKEYVCFHWNSSRLARTIVNACQLISLPKCTDVLNVLIQKNCNFLGQANFSGKRTIFWGILLVIVTQRRCVSDPDVQQEHTEQLLPLTNSTISLFKHIMHILYSRVSRFWNYNGNIA